VDDEHEARQDRDSEEAAVDRRVPEGGIDPVERRVSVADAHLRVPEDVAGLVLVDAEQREGNGHCTQLHPERCEPVAAPGQPRERHREQREGQVEGEQLDRALAQILAPGEAEPAPEDECCQRERHRAELSIPDGSRITPELPRERERRGGHDAVHRHQQVRIGRADLDRNPRRYARERGEREQPGPALEQCGAACRQDEAGQRDPRENRTVAMRRQVVGEHHAAGSPSR